MRTQKPVISFSNLSFYVSITDIKTYNDRLKSLSESRGNVFIDFRLLLFVSVIRVPLSLFSEVPQ